MGVTIKLEPAPKIVSHILDDKVGRFSAETWGNVFKKYVPMDSGLLSSSYTTEPWKVKYVQPYSHYQWQGISKTNRLLNYSREQHPLATSHWEEKAFAENKEMVAKAITEYIRRK